MQNDSGSKQAVTGKSIQLKCMCGPELVQEGEWESVF